MPPTSANVRRRPGILARERKPVASAQESPTEFLRPNLPPLSTAHSARRQYSYGVDEGPSPSRPGGGEGIVELETAVQGALARHERRAAEQAAEDAKNARRRQSDVDLFLEEAHRDDEEEERRAADQRAMPPPSFTPVPSKWPRLSDRRLIANPFRPHRLKARWVCLFDRTKRRK